MSASDPTALRDRSRLFGALPPAVLGEVAADRYWLVVHHGTELRSIPLEDPAELVIGRGDQADVVIPDISMSRRHARLCRRGGAVSLEDLGSSNGTHLSGQRISGEKRLSPGEEIALGEVRAWLLLASPVFSLSEGLEPHPQFLRLLDDEIVRARTFGRTFGMVMIRATERLGALLAQSVPRIRGVLRPVDRLGIFSHSMIEILVPEASSEELLELGRRIASERLASEPPLEVGIAMYPETASTGEAIVEQALGALQHASTGSPVAGPARATEAPPANGPPRTGLPPVVGNPRIRELYETARRLGEKPVPVLIYGETGAGKEMIAQAIHAASPRRGSGLVSLNCGALAPQLIQSTLFGHERGAFTGADQRRSGVFEAADGGTLLLDEVGELPPDAQAALLRVLETGRMLRVGGTVEIPVDVRVIAATHRPLEQMALRGEFRTDLLYRLNTVVLQVPPLRERLDEIVPLAQFFLEDAGRRYGTSAKTIATDAAVLLLEYSWPGNVRELKNVIEHAAVNAHGDAIMASHLRLRLQDGRAGTSLAPAPPPDSSVGLRERVRAFEKQVILAALEANEWNQTATAKHLRLPLRTLTHKLRQLGLKQGQ